MRNTTKIQEFIETLSALIQAGAPGFLDRLPSRRELAAQYGISPASVQIALQELEKRGLVTNYPQKGSRVNPRPGCAVAAATAREEVIEVTVFENLPHQTGFWLERFRAFEQKNPSCRIRARFCDSGSSAIPAGTRAALRPPRLAKLPPAVPLNEIFGNDRLDAVRGEALEQFADWDWSLCLPYQVQMHAFVYRGSDRNPLVPAEGETVAAWLERVRAALGRRSLLPPRNDWLAAACGVVDAVGRTPAGIETSEELYNYFNALAFYARQDLIRRNRTRRCCKAAGSPGSSTSRTTGTASGCSNPETGFRSPPCPMRPEQPTAYSSPAPPCSARRRSARPNGGSSNISSPPNSSLRRWMR